MGKDSILECWQHTEQKGGVSIILPDGCRDVILRRDPHAAAKCFISELADGPHRVEAEVGVGFIGFRLHPAVVLERPLEALMLEVQGDVHRLGERIEDNSQRCERAAESLLCIAETQLPIAQVALELGVSVRSLQRVIGRATGRSPGFWRQLARARKAARGLSCAVGLADYAVMAGFADQPHMNREFQRWFAVSPHEFYQREDLCDQLQSNAFS